jgi:glycosyltransferase involved in cell wall biosynthesis
VDEAHVQFIGGVFPKLLYVGDVPVEASYHGSALLHRLLSDYPGDHLTVIETATTSNPSRRLPEARYISHQIGNPRWLNTRFHPYAVAWYSRAAASLASKVSQSINGFDCEGVLTVAHGFGWLAAAGVAREKNVPLHLIVHDDWPQAADVAPAFRKWLDREFGRVYRQAHSRLCVSQAMSCAYRERYGEPASIMYPMRASDAPEFNHPPEHLARNDKPFTIAFAGTINSEGYLRGLVGLQDSLKPFGGRLLIFGTLTPEQAQQAGLNDPGTEICGLLDAAVLIQRLRAEADALFVPMSFDAADRDNMEMAFPSKLADYTAAGLPLLIYGPDYCSAVSWARENEGVAEIAEAQAELAKSVERLANDPALRVALGKRALEAGSRYFSHARVKQLFHEALTGQAA